MGSSKSTLEGFQESCHSDFRNFHTNPDNNALTRQYPNTIQFKKWRSKIEPLLKNSQSSKQCKYLLLPSLITPLFQEQNRVSLDETLNPQPNFIEIEYEPYIYTLDLELQNRRAIEEHFSERELWKIMKYLSGAAIEWHRVYPTPLDLSVRSVVMLKEGKVAVFCP